LIFCKGAGDMRCQGSRIDSRKSNLSRRPTMNQVLSSAVLSLVLFSGVQYGIGQVQRALLNVDGLSIPRDGALASFHIDTWGVVPVAVCNIPPLWEIKAEKFMDSAGLLSGRSDPHRTLSKLDHMYLVDVYQYQPLPKGDPNGDYHPSTFAGWFEVFDGNGALIKRHRAFRANNFHLTPAARCPDAPPAEP